MMQAQLAMHVLDDEAIAYPCVEGCAQIAPTNL